MEEIVERNGVINDSHGVINDFHGVINDFHRVRNGQSTYVKRSLTGLENLLECWEKSTKKKKYIRNL